MIGDLDLYNCSFCDKPHGQVKRLMSRDKDTCICDECVLACIQLIVEDLGRDAVVTFPEEGNHETLRETSVRAFDPLDPNAVLDAIIDLGARVSVLEQLAGTDKETSA